MSDDWLFERQIQKNADSRHSWCSFSTHRHRVMRELIDRVPKPGARLCVLGAGNCNDLALATLSEVFAEVHLVDIDAGALKEAVHQQGVGETPAIRLHGGIDVTGLWGRLSRLQADSKRPRTELPESPVTHIARLLSGREGPFHRVVSLCLLSQLIEAVVQTLGEAHPQFLPVLQRIRHDHLRLLLELTAPQGEGLLISDFVSSETIPELAATPESQLPAMLAGELSRGNFFHGTNPSLIAHMFQRDPGIAPLVTDFAVRQPWVWDFGPRQYAVTALRFRRA